MNAEIPKSASDVRAFIKSGIRALPEYGGAITRLFDGVSSSTQRSVDRTMRLLEHKLGTFGNRIDPTQVDNDEFAELFKSSYLVVFRSHHEEKLRAAANILANLMLKPGDPEKSSYEELDHLVRCLDALSIGAISVLGAVRHLVRSAPPGIRSNVYPPQLRTALTGIDPSLLMSLVSELRSLKLVRVEDGGIRLPDDSQALIELTPLGDRFVHRFIEGHI
jgi:hypothetical protein